MSSVETSTPIKAENRRRSFHEIASKIGRIGVGLGCIALGATLGFELSLPVANIGPADIAISGLFAAGGAFLGYGASRLMVRSSRSKQSQN